MDIVLTGHSLGGGLAGAVGAVKGLEAHLFDHMPFEASVEAIYAAGTAEFPNAIEAAWAQFIYGEAPATPPSYADVTATHVDADLLAFSRDLLDSMNGNALSSYGAALNENPILNAIAAHSITLLAILQWADENAVETYWTAVASTVLPLVLSADVAEAAGYAAGAALPSFGTDIAEYMSTTLAYSDSLGGVALLRLFDDLNDFGEAVGVGSAEALAFTALSYSAGLALAGVTEGFDEGVLLYDQDAGVLNVDLSSETWSFGTQGSDAAQRELFNNLLEQAMEGR